MLGPVLEEGRLRVIVIHVTGVGSEAHCKEIEEWHVDSTVKVICTTTQKRHGHGQLATTAILHQWEQENDIWDVNS